ncbi:MAG: hypothetical protein IJ128_03140 [Firmicutes bacterium]|nr:hypothetical protein [Bacillota bacterium]
MPLDSIFRVIKEEATEKGIAKGRRDVVDRLIDKFGYSLEEACDMAGLKKEDYVKQDS